MTNHNSISYLLKKYRLKKFVSMKDLNYNMTDFKDDLCTLVIQRTSKDLIRYNHKKIFFIHPTFKDYACDINADIYNITTPMYQRNQGRIFPFRNYIQLTISINKTTQFIVYKYDKFVKEALKLYKKDMVLFGYHTHFFETPNNNDETYDNVNDNEDNDDTDDTDDDDNDNNNDDNDVNDNDDNVNVNYDNDVNDNDDNDDTDDTDDDDNDNNNDDNDVNDNDDNVNGNCSICGKAVKISDL